METYRGIDITRPLHLSSDLLRKYESWKLIPAAQRQKGNNYRIYTEVHKQFFICSRKMLDGFSWTEVAKIMSRLVKGEVEEATVLAIEMQAIRGKTYKQNQNVIDQLHQSIGGQIENSYINLSSMKRHLMIREVSDLLNVPISTLRVWEQQKLFDPIRKENNYRSFDKRLVSRLFVIKSLRSSGLSFEKCYEILEDLDHENYQEILRILEGRVTEMKKEIHEGLKALGHFNDLVNFLDRSSFFEKKLNKCGKKNLFN